MSKMQEMQNSPNTAVAALLRLIGREGHKRAGLSLYRVFCHLGKPAWEIYVCPTKY
jgi:hypothetical protein